ncbi:MAG: ribosomal protein S18-alanine N-acetyltransferase [Chloroflexi bacterium]|nr:ribosomal protein S18-alanine N-acetyltransferase [Chloroflexota bacterium]
MSAVEKQPQRAIMPFAVRPMEERDIAQSAEIERDAFPTLFPPTAFRRELKNRIASYFVSWKREDAPCPRSQSCVEPNGPIIGRWLNNARSLWQRRHTVWEPGQQFLTGFLGTWYMVDEAHIVAIGVRREYRGQGIGELLLIGAIEHAMSTRASTVTLEVRVSNRVAQNLYHKYGFKERGLRKGYYTDNREDALIMTTDFISTPSYSEMFAELVAAHEQRWGESERIIL